MTVVIRGPVSIKVQGLLKGKQLPGTWGVLCDGESKGDKRPRIELYEEKTSALPVLTLRLEHLKFSDKSFRHHEPYFVLSIKKEKHQFQFESLSDKEDWVHSLCHVSTELWKQRVSVRETSDEQDSNQDMMSENLLYDSSGSIQQYKVSINPTKASEANNLQGSYILSPTKDALQLLDIVCFKGLHEWPYRQIRKYGRTRLIFRLEVGRKCSTGEGEFEFVTPEGATLTDLISLYMEQAKKEEVRRSQDNPTRPTHGLKLALQPQRGHQSMDSLTPSPQSLTPSPSHSPVLPPRRNTTENAREAKPPETRSWSYKSADGVVGIKRDTPLPVPRSKFNIPPRQESSSATKQQEKEQKETGTKKQGIMKKELKGHDKPQKTRSEQIPFRAPAIVSDRIYDEPEETEHIYSLAEDEEKDGWKKQARHESDNVLVETDSRASLSECKAEIPARPRKSYSPRMGADADDIYNRLGDFSTQQATVSLTENVYGMASATVTVGPSPRRPPPPIPVCDSSEYEDTNTIIIPSHSAQSAGDGYEDTSVPAMHRPVIKTTIYDDDNYDDDDYDDVS